MNERVFNDFRELIYKKSGISLSDEKHALLTARIGKRLRALQIESETDYLQVLAHDEDGQEIVNLLDVVSTNTTYFYREHEHFIFLEKALRAVAESRSGDIRLWCAASSSGEEPYTIKMTADRALAGTGCQLKMLATDISITILKKAQQAIYAPAQVDKLPREWQERYLRPVKTPKGELVEVVPELKRDLLFKRLNLNEVPYPLNGPFDFIFCRNVMIYFDAPVREKVVREFFRLIKPGGYLVLSKTESLVAIEHKFSGCGNSIYRKPE